MEANKQSYRYLWDKYLYQWSPRKRKKNKKNEQVLEEIIIDNFPNLARDIKLQILEAEWNANRKTQINLCQDI